MITGFITYLVGFVGGCVVTFLLVRATPIKVIVPVEFPFGELNGLLQLTHSHLGNLLSAARAGMHDKVRLHHDRAEAHLTSARVLLANHGGRK